MNQSELETKTTKELVALHNALPGVKPVARFESRDVAVKRILRHLSNVPAGQSTTPAVATIDQAPLTNQVDASRRPKTEPRAGSKRALFLREAQAGAKFADARAVVGWNEPQAREAVRILRRMGHPIQVSSDGGMKLS